MCAFVVLGLVFPYLVPSTLFIVLRSFLFCQQFILVLSFGILRRIGQSYTKPMDRFLRHGVQ